MSSALLLLLFQASVALAGADCNEKPIRIEDLQAMADSGKFKTMQDFLAAIPRDSMQNFTFVTNSLSLHRGNPESDENGQGKVNAMWPRVLRSTADGKITISFVCDPKNPSYGKVETTYFDDATKRVKTVEWDFGAESKNESPKTTRNPQSCLGCHAGSPIGGMPTLKFNWQEYFQWGDCKRDRGITFYGASDDKIDDGEIRIGGEQSERSFPGCKGDDYRSAHTQEVKDYAAFRAKQKDNDCFNPLPWPEGNTDATYPFSSEKKLGFDRRPNLRFTTNYVHLAARQLEGMLHDGNPLQYRLLKYYLTLENLRCLDAADRAAIRGITGISLAPMNYDSQDLNDYFNVAKSSPLLYAAAKRAGIEDKDWTLEFKGKDNDYAAGFAPVSSLVTGDILEGLAEKNPRVAAASKNIFANVFLDNVLEGYQPDNYRCIDATGRAIRGPDAPGNFGKKIGAEGSQLCSVLHEENRKNLEAVLKRLQADGCPVAETPHVPVPPLADDAERVLASLDQGAIDRGRALVQPDSKGKCVMCHSAAAASGLPPDYRFVPNEKGDRISYEESLAVLKARTKEGFFSDLEMMLIDEKAMPPIQNELTDGDRSDIAAYIKSLAR